MCAGYYYYYYYYYHYYYYYYYYHHFYYYYWCSGVPVHSASVQGCDSCDRRRWTYSVM
jgi:hypothetical protein